MSDAPIRHNEYHGTTGEEQHAQQDRQSRKGGSGYTRGAGLEVGVGGADGGGCGTWRARGATRVPNLPGVRGFRARRNSSREPNEDARFHAALARDGGDWRSAAPLGSDTGWAARCPHCGVTDLSSLFVFFDLASSCAVCSASIDRGDGTGFRIAQAVVARYGEHAFKGVAERYA